MVEVAAGAEHTVAVSTTGELWGWGCAKQGQLGDVLQQTGRAFISPPARIGLPSTAAPKDGSSDGGAGSIDGARDGSGGTVGAIDGSGGERRQLYLSAGPAARHTFVSVDISHVFTHD